MPERKRTTHRKGETHLDTFAAAFPTEGDLRNKMLTLLRKMGRKELRIHHGIHERGKDLLFYAPRGLGEDALYANCWPPTAEKARPGLSRAGKEGGRSMLRVVSCRFPRMARKPARHVSYGSRSGDASARQASAWGDRT